MYILLCIYIVRTVRETSRSYRSGSPLLDFIRERVSDRLKTALLGEVLPIVSEQIVEVETEDSDVITTEDEREAFTQKPYLVRWLI